MSVPQSWLTKAVQTKKMFIDIERANQETINCNSATNNAYLELTPTTITNSNWSLTANNWVADAALMDSRVSHVLLNVNLLTDAINASNVLAFYKKSSSMTQAMYAPAVANYYSSLNVIAPLSSQDPLVMKLNRAAGTLYVLIRLLGYFMHIAP